MFASRVRRYSSAVLRPLPPSAEWRKAWDLHILRRPRVCLGNPHTAARVVDAFFPPNQHSPDPRPKLVVEAFSGPGVLTRALLQLPPTRLRRLIVLESNPKFFARVKELEAEDPRITALPLDAFGWDSYHEIAHRGLLDDLDIQDWQHESDLAFVGHIPHSVHGEQLVAQLLRAIPERSWLFKYGRMPMHLLMADALYHRIDAPLRKAKRCKLSVVAEATAHFRRPLPPPALRPYDDHFWPPSYNARMALPDSRKPGHPMVAATFVPRPTQVITPGMLDKWDYCLRRLFVLKSSELRKALPSLAPGANNMIQYMQGPHVAPEDRVDVERPVHALTVDNWASIVRAFDRWPFAPKMLYIQDGIVEKR